MFLTSNYRKSPVRMDFDGDVIVQQTIHEPTNLVFSFGLIPVHIEFVGRPGVYTFKTSIARWHAFKDPQLLLITPSGPRIVRRKFDLILEGKFPRSGVEVWYKDVFVVKTTRECRLYHKLFDIVVRSPRRRKRVKRD